MMDGGGDGRQMRSIGTENPRKNVQKPLSDTGLKKEHKFQICDYEELSGPNLVFFPYCSLAFGTHGPICTKMDENKGSHH